MRTETHTADTETETHEQKSDIQVGCKLVEARKKYFLLVDQKR